MSAAAASSSEIRLYGAPQGSPTYSDHDLVTLGDGTLAATVVSGDENGGASIYVNLLSPDGTFLGFVDCIQTDGWIYGANLMTTEAGGYALALQVNDSSGSHVVLQVMDEEGMIEDVSFDAPPGASAGPLLLDLGGGGIGLVLASTDGTGTTIWLRDVPSDLAVEPGNYASVRLEGYEATGHLAALAEPDGTLLLVLPAVVNATGDNVLVLQRLDIDGHVIAGPIIIDATGTGDDRPDMTELSNGSYVVTWQVLDADGALSAIMAMIVDANGAQLVAPFQVSSDTGENLEPSVTALADGGFVVTWASTERDGAGGGILARAFNGDGTAASDELLLNSYQAGDETQPTVTALADGGFAVTWASVALDGGTRDRVVFRAFDAIPTSPGHTVDTADFSGLGSGVSANLATGTASTGDSLAGIVNLVGSAFNDVLTGDAGDNRLTGGAGDDRLAGGRGADTLVGGAGSDTADYASSSAAVTIDLGAGTASGGDATGDKLLGIENLTGSAYDDRLSGDAGANVLDGGPGNDILIGGAGADRLIGGAGNDTVDYSASPAAVIVDLRTGGAGGDAQGDTFSSIENVIGSAYADRLIGDAGVNILDGGAGDDVLVGGAGGDTLIGGDGNDTVDYTDAPGAISANLVSGRGWGGDSQGDTFQSIENLIGSSFDDTLKGDAGANILNGGAGDDILAGGQGADRLIGGAGTDTADYSGSTAAVTVNLASGTGSGGDAQGDTLASIENLVGSAYADRLIGDAGANVLNGGAGDDVLIGGAGADTLIGGAGIDTADYSASGAAVTVDLAAGSGSGGDAAGDTLAGIENLTGSAYADRLVGDAGTNILSGGAGDDVLAGGAGADTLIGGAGIDTADYSASGAAVTVSLLTGTGTGGDAAGDTLSSIESLIGSAYADRLVGNSGANVLNGGAGDDVLIGGAGADTLIGGDGTDTADYSQSAAAVTVSLATGLGAGGDAAGDMLLGIEVLLGSAYADRLTGGAGDDNLQGAAGDDVLAGGAGADMLDGGDGFDTADYSASSAGVTVDLGTGTGSGGDADGDTLLGIEALIGSSHGDVLIGDGGFNRLSGGAGDDVLAGMGGDDVLIGGSGIDTAVFAGSSELYSWLREADGSWSVAGPNGTATLSSIERLQFDDGEISLRHESTPHDLDGDGKADLLLRNGQNGNVSTWVLSGDTIVGSVKLSPVFNWSPAAVADFNGDGKADILWIDGAGRLAIWTMDQLTSIKSTIVDTLPAGWHFEAAADADGDGMADILVRNDNGRVGLWTMDGATRQTAGLAGTIGTDWSFKGMADGDGDGRADILWQKGDGTITLWQSTGTGFVDVGSPASLAGSWRALNYGDIDGDGKADLLLQDGTGKVAVWKLDGPHLVAAKPLAVLGSAWTFEALADIDGNGTNELIWHNTDNGRVAALHVDNLTISSSVVLGAAAADVWTIF